MSWLSNLSIKTKILVIPAVAIAGFLLSLAFNANVNTSNADRLQAIRGVFFPVVQSSKSNLVRIDRIVEILNSAVSSGEEDMIQSAEIIYKDMQEGFSRQARLWPEGSQGVSELEQQAISYFSVAKKLSSGMIQGDVDPSQLSGMIEEMNTSLHALQRSLKAYSTNAEESFNAVVLAADKASSDGLKTGFLILLVTIIIIGITAYSIAHLITRNIGSMINSLKDIAQGEGDLTQRIEVNGADELGEMVKWFNLFMDKLHHSIGNVVKAINPLTTLSSDLGAITGRTSQLTDQQSNATEQVTHSVDDMFVSVQQVARHASSAAEAASDADRESKEGRNVVEQTVDSINDLAQNVEKAGTVIRQLEEDTEGVGSILDVIKGIAEQTNLLALNAAIEAARAGEQGRGFAVVADEVRTLASRTQDSTQEIQKVIERLQSAAQSAVSVMDEGQEGAKLSVEKAALTGQSLRSITKRVESISQMNIQIAEATEQQENASNSIKANVVGIKENAITAVENVREVEVASEALVSIAETLRTITNQFKV